MVKGRYPFGQNYINHGAYSNYLLSKLTLLSNTALLRLLRMYLLWLSLTKTPPCSAELLELSSIAIASASASYVSELQIRFRCCSIPLSGLKSSVHSAGSEIVLSLFLAIIAARSFFITSNYVYVNIKQQCFKDTDTVPFVSGYQFYAPELHFLFVSVAFRFQPHI